MKWTAHLERLSAHLRRLGGLLPREERRRTAQVAALVVLLAAVAAVPAVGISSDEAATLAAAEREASWWGGMLRSPLRAYGHVDAAFGPDAERPPLAKAAMGILHAAGTGLGASHLFSFRLAAFLGAAVLTALLSLLGAALADGAGALLAPALFWLAPRHFQQALVGSVDLPLATLWLATVYAYRSSLDPAIDRRGRRTAALACGLLFGAALATRRGAWLLLPVLLLHWALSNFRALRRLSWRERLTVLPSAFPAMAALGPPVVLATWPWLWRQTGPRLAGLLAPQLQPLSTTLAALALTVPAATLAAMAAGVALSAARVAAALRGRAAEVSLSDELLLLCNGLLPLLLAPSRSAPGAGGAGPWLPAAPFLALLAARALAWAGRLLWPARPWAATAAVASLALAPALWSVVHAHPFESAAFSAAAGGAGGAASLGASREPGGDAAAALLPALNEHAAPGVAVWFADLAPEAVRLYRRDGRLRPDLRAADGPEAADLAVHQPAGPRDREYRTWTVFGSARAVAGAYLDELPLVLIYARPGAWR